MTKRLAVTAVMLAAGLTFSTTARAQGSTPPAQSTEAPATGGDKIGSVPAFTAPSGWGTNRSEQFTFRYPPEYTSDLDFTTREIVVSRRSDKAELIRVSFFNSTDPVFRKVADDVAYYREILGSAVKK